MSKHTEAEIAHAEAQLASYGVDDDTTIPYVCCVNCGFFYVQDSTCRAEAPSIDASGNAQWPAIFPARKPQATACGQFVHYEALAQGLNLMANRVAAAKSGIITNVPPGGLNAR